jgi:hypothetical protein
MDSESLKWMILIAAAVGVFWVARASREQSDAAPLTPEAPPDPTGMQRNRGFDDSGAVIPCEQENLVVLDYAFKKIDLRSGPADPSDFFDELTVSFYDRSTGHRWKREFQVGTPLGIGSYMREQKWRSLRMDGGLVIVDKFDIDLLLDTILDPGDVDTPKEELERQVAAKVNEQNYL